MKRKLDDNEESLPRYSRQMLVPQIGSYGQESLRSASVIVIGGNLVNGYTTCLFIYLYPHQSLLNCI